MVIPATLNNVKRINLNHIKNSAMKKIIILLCCAGAFITSFAQYDRSHNDGNGNYAYGKGAYHYDGKYDHGERESRIEKINREFDFRVRSIENDFRLTPHQRRVQIRITERERATQIRILKRRYHSW
jgi:hypothetical protein